MEVLSPVILHLDCFSNIEEKELAINRSIRKHHNCQQLRMVRDILFFWVFVSFISCRFDIINWKHFTTHPPMRVHVFRESNSSKYFVDEALMALVTNYTFRLFQLIPLGLFITKSTKQGTHFFFMYPKLSQGNKQPVVTKCNT